MKQIFALTTAMLSSEFSEQYSEDHLFETLCVVRQKTGIEFHKEKIAYQLTGQWLCVLEAYDILLEFLLPENVANIQTEEDFLSENTCDDNPSLNHKRGQLNHSISHGDRCNCAVRNLCNGHDQVLHQEKDLTAASKSAQNYSIDVSAIKVEHDSDEISAFSVDVYMPVERRTENSAQIFTDIKPVQSDSDCSDSLKKQNQKQTVFMQSCSTGSVSKRTSLPSRLPSPKKKYQQDDRNSFTKRKKIVGLDDKIYTKKKRGRKKIRSENDVFKCQLCDYVGKNITHLKNHRRRLHGNMRTYKCNQCDKSYGVNADLNRHKKTVHETPVFLCQVCNKSYKSKAGYDDHIKSHEDDYVKPIFNCMMCEKTYSSKIGLANHIKGEHLDMKESFLCAICGKSFTNLTAYTGHSNLHAGVKPYSCNTCGKAFAFRKALWEHKHVHDKTCRYSCDICGKSFKQNQCLRTHKKIHNDIRDYTCSICGKAFTQKQALNRHKRIHSGDQPFECIVCFKRFNDTSIIRRHVIFMHKKESESWRSYIIIHKKIKPDT